MKTFFYLPFAALLLAGCSQKLYSHYIVSKKFPQSIPELSIEIHNDTTGEIVDLSSSKKLTFNFIKARRNFLVITHAKGMIDIISLSEGDTLIYRKKELYFFNAKHKLIFVKK